MVVLARRIENPFDVPVQRSHRGAGIMVGLTSSPSARARPGGGWLLAVSLSICCRVRLFYPDRIAYRSGIGVHPLIAFLLPNACPSQTVFPWWLAYPHPTASHHRPWCYLHWLSRSRWMDPDYRWLYASESGPERGWIFNQISDCMSVGVITRTSDAPHLLRGFRPFSRVMR
jgi:hypothetical protein